MPPPSSGGVHILQMLSILEHFPVTAMGAGSADTTHLLAEVMRLAFADRSMHLGDPDFYPVPVDWLVSEDSAGRREHHLPRPLDAEALEAAQGEEVREDYAAELAATVDMQQARPSTDVAPGVMPPYESVDTTHFSIADADGNVVSNTYTLNLRFGSGFRYKCFRLSFFKYLRNAAVWVIQIAKAAPCRTFL